MVRIFNSCDIILSGIATIYCYYLGREVSSKAKFKFCMDGELSFCYQSIFMILHQVSALKDSQVACSLYQW
jgi:hypothetical protein